MERIAYIYTGQVKVNTEIEWGISRNWSKKANREVDTNIGFSRE